MNLSNLVRRSVLTKEVPPNMKESPYVFYAFYQLYCHLNGQRPHFTLMDIGEQLYNDYTLNLQAKKSLFITWKRLAKSDDEYHLRGCIGTFAKLNIKYAIERYSIYAAMEDSRFPPIQLKELKLLQCNCNILTNFTTLWSKNSTKRHENNKLAKNDIFDWEIGKHGIELKFKEPTTGEKLSATFLPDVMVEQDWGKEETFYNLIEKAGVISNIDNIMDNYDIYFIEVIRYEGQKSAINYEQFNKKLWLLEASTDT